MNQSIITLKVGKECFQLLPGHQAPCTFKGVSHFVSVIKPNTDEQIVLLHDGTKLIETTRSHVSFALFGDNELRVDILPIKPRGKVTVVDSPVPEDILNEID